MRITTGITHLLPEWEIVIQQIGFPFEVVSLQKSILIDQYSVIIVTKTGVQSLKDILLKYIKYGGSILAEADVAKWLFDIENIPTFVSTIEPNDDPIYNDVLPGFIQTKLFLPQNAEMLESESGRKLVQTYTFGKGTAIILPGGFSNIILDARVKRRNFPTRASHLPSERVGRISKHTIREVVQRSLEHLHFVRQLPFLSLSPFPDEKQSIFNFRIDTDFASEKEIDSLYQLCLKHDISANWFVETKSTRDNIGQFARMQYQEIGLHCYHHKVSSSYFFNKSNIKEGCQILNNANIPFYGFAAPYGEWNIPLAKAVEGAGFIYSSEFTLDYDNLPFYPYLNSHFSSVLQIPIHPISTGRLRNARHMEDDMKKYFEDVIQNRIEHNLPFFFYDHPSSGNIQVLNWLLQHLNKKNISTISLQDYANWWKKRMEIIWAPEFDAGRIVTNWKHSNSSMYVIIKKSPKELVLTKMENVINLNTLKWQNKKTSSKLKPSMVLRTQLNRKMIINDFFHFFGRLKQ